MSNINIGIDVDGTLTNEVIGREMMSLNPSIIERAMLDCSPKNGIDILFEKFEILSLEDKRHLETLLRDGSICTEYHTKS